MAIIRININASDEFILSDILKSNNVHWTSFSILKSIGLVFLRRKTPAKKFLPETNHPEKKPVEETWNQSSRKRKKPAEKTMHWKPKQVTVC